MRHAKLILFGACHFAALAIAKPVDPNSPSAIRVTPNLVKRVDLGPSPYPYGPELVNEFRWHGWDPADAGQKADAEKLHTAWDDWTNMVSFAWREADQVTATFKRWFDEANAPDVKKVLEKLVSQTGIQQPTPLMKEWICEREDVKNGCTSPGKTAYSVSNLGQFHFCPAGINRPNTRDLTCVDLDSFASVKMKSIAFTLLHESTHWIKVGDVALGTHIKDFANGAIDCFNLPPNQKLTNAQNYAFLGAEAYFQVKGCTFNDPPPGTKDTDDIEGEFSASLSCNCDENGCTWDSPGCCGNGSCVCSCDESGCSTDSLACCANGER